MAEIIYVNSNNEYVRRLVLWRVYQRLAARTTQPHTFWSGRHRIVCNSVQPMACTQKYVPCTFMALLEMSGHKVGVINVSMEASTILRAIHGLEELGAEIIVCGINETEGLIITQCLSNPSMTITLPDFDIRPDHYQRVLEHPIFDDVVNRIIEEIDRRIQRN